MKDTEFAQQLVNELGKIGMIIVDKKEIEKPKILQEKIDAILSEVRYARTYMKDGEAAARTIDAMLYQYRDK